MRKVYLSKKHKKILGICGSIAETYDIDPNLIRLIVTFLAVVTAVIPAILFYLLAWIIFPEKNGSQNP